MPRNIGPELMADLQRRYRAGELSKSDYQFERARLEERIARGTAIERSTGEKVLKWGLVIGMIIMAGALMAIFRDWFFYIVGGAQIILAVMIARRP